ncbi:MAG: HAMP domain-containing protein [Formivibrio sp.]|nr:HAMP domain-containing protein [Formivibrio sp.]
MAKLASLLKHLATGHIPAELPPDGEYREELQQLIDAPSAITHFAQVMAEGDLSATLHQGGTLAGSLKALHADLRHLTWQTQKVAAGDFTQRVDFLGDFLIAFNSMVESLAMARDERQKKPSTIHRLQ